MQITLSGTQKLRHRSLCPLSSMKSCLPQAQCFSCMRSKEGCSLSFVWASSGWGQNCVQFVAHKHAQKKLQTERGERGLKKKKNERTSRSFSFNLSRKLKETQQPFTSLLSR